MQLGKKTFLINSYSDLIDGVRFWNGTAAGTTANATKVDISGFGTFKLSEVSDVKVMRGFASDNQEYTFTTANAAEMTGTAPTAAKNVNLKIYREGLEYDASYGTNRSRFRTPLSYDISIPASTNPGTQAGKRVIAKLIYNRIKFEIDRYPGDIQPGFDISYTGSDIDTIDTLVFTPVSEKVRITKFTFEDELDKTSDTITAFLPVETTQNTEGRATGKWLKENEFLLTEASGMPYNAVSNDTRPTRDSAIYSILQFKVTSNAPGYGNQASGQVISTEQEFMVYMEENTDNLSTTATVTAGKLVSTGLIKGLSEYFGRATAGYTFYNEEWGNPLHSGSDVWITQQTGSADWDEAASSSVVRTDATDLAADIADLLDTVQSS